MTVVLSALESGIIWAIMAIGVYIAYRVLDIADLSSESVFVVGGSLAVLTINLGLNPIVAILISVLGGGLSGFITGILHTKLKIPGLLSGIIMMVALIPVCLALNAVSSSSDYINFIATASIAPGKLTIFNWASTLNPLIISLIISPIILVGIFFLLYWFFGTQIGSSIRATGKNKIMARAQGINSSWMIVFGLVISSALVALSGSLFAQSQLSTEVNQGRASIVVALASIFLGEAIFGRKSFFISLISVIVGSIVYFGMIQALIMVLSLYNMNDLIKVFQAAGLVLVLCIPLVKGIVIRRRRKRKVNLSNLEGGI